MAENFYTLLTDIGLAKVANAQITQEKIDLVEMAVGDGNGSYYNPSAAQTTLVKEVWRGPIGLVGIDETNDRWINIESSIPASEGGFSIREVGLFDADGDLVAIGKYPETYKPKIDEGSSKDLYIRMIIEVSNASAVTLKIDPTIIIATRKYVDEKIAFAVGPVSQNIQQLQDALTTHMADLANLVTCTVTSQSILTATVTNVVFNSVPQNDFVEINEEGQLKMLKGGTYLIMSFTAFSNHETGIRQVNTAHFSEIALAVTGVTQTRISIATVQVLEVNEVIAHNVYQSSGSSLITSENGLLQIVKLGDK